jgi:tRNA (guanine-N7-)-methyltransferase
LNTESSPTSDRLLLSLATIVERLEPAKIFSRDQPLEVELGSGDGSFLVQYAALHPEVNFIGVERLLGRLRKIDRKAQRAGLTNVRGIRIEAGYFLEFLLPPQSAQTIHLYFPDPWPKRKHHKHRLVNDRFPILARQALRPGGVVYLRTDDRDYFNQMTTVFAACSYFKSIATPASVAEVVTDFEREFLRRGIPALRAAYQLGVD